MVELNPVLAGLEPDIEGLIVNRLTEPPVYAIAPIDRCYALTGAIKLTWEGISGGSGVGEAVARLLRRPAARGGRCVSTRADHAARGGAACPTPSSPSSAHVRSGTRRRRCWRSTCRYQSRAAAQVYMIALTIQLMIEPARRSYDDATRERLVELFGAPERWAVTTRSLVWAQLDVLVPAFTGSTTVSVPIACHYDLELAAAKYLHSLPDGEAPLALHFNGTIYYPGDDGGLQMVLVPWSKSIDFRMPVSVWRETIEHYYPNTGWVGAALADAGGAAAREAARADCRRSTRACEQLLDEADGD